MSSRHGSGTYPNNATAIEFAPRRDSKDHSIYASSDDVVHNGENWCSKPSDDPWDPCILTLDGGGIRGYSSLLILQALMREISRWEQKFEQDHQARATSRDDSPKPDRGRVTQIKSEHGVVSDTLGPSRSPSSPSFRVRKRSSASEAIRTSEEDTKTEELGPFHESKLLPCHYFDYMYGTSTGGLIATMLGRLRMSVPQCLDIYRDVGEELFGRRRSVAPLTTKYHHKPLEIAVRDIIRNHCKQHQQGEPCDGDDWHPWYWGIPKHTDANFDAHICQSICLTAVNNGKIDEAHLLRTYDHRYQDIPNWITPYNQGADKLRIWQVTRATSAAPFYFDSLEARVNGEKWTFKDGGIRENNPSGAAFSEFVSMYGEAKEPVLLLSIGTGRPDESQDGFASAWPAPLGKSKLVKKIAEKFAVFKNVLIKYTDGELKHRDMLVTAKGQHTWYKRLNVSQGLETLPLDDWKKGEWTDPATGKTTVISGGASLTRMEEVTRAYLVRDIDMTYDTYAPPRMMLSQTAEKLVRQRRARQALSENTNDAELKKRWDTYMGKYLTGEYTADADGPITRSPQAETKVPA